MGTSPITIGVGNGATMRPRRIKPAQGAAPPAQDQPPRARQAEFVICDQTIENFFGKLKDFKRIAMRADKTDQSFEAMIYLCSAIINSR